MVSVQKACNIEQLTVVLTYKMQKLLFGFRILCVVILQISSSNILFKG